MADKWDQYEAKGEGNAPPAAGPDKWAQYEAKAPPPANHAETAADAAVGVGTGLAYDFDDEVVGALAKVKEYAKFLGPAAPFVEAGGTLAQGYTGEKTYEGARNKYRERKALAATRSPTANLAGQVGGALVGGIGTGGSSTGGLLLRGAKVGGRLVAEGAAQGLGASEATSLEGLADDAAAGAGTTLAVGSALGVAGKVGGKMLKTLDPARWARAAERSEVAAAGLNPRQVDKAPGKVAGQAMRQRKQGIGGPFAGKETIMEQAGAAQAARHGEREALAKEFSNAGAQVHGQMIGMALRREAAGLDDVADADKIAALMKYAAMYEAKGPMSFDAANRGRASWARKVNFQSEAEKALVQQEVHKVLNDALEASADSVNPGAGKKWRELGQDEAAAIRAEQGAGGKLGQEAANRVGSPSDQLVGGLAVAKLGPAGLAAVGANRIFRGRERSAHAALMRGGSKVLGAGGGRPVAAFGEGLRNRAVGVGAAGGRVAAGQSRVASQQDEESQAKEHFLESMTNPEYRQASLEAREEIADPYGP